MKSWVNIVNVVILVMGLGIILFDFQLYNVFEDQKAQFDAMSDQQKSESQIYSTKLKEQQDNMDHVNKSLAEAQQELKDHDDAIAQQKDALEAQKETLLQEVQKRQEITNQSKAVQTTLVDIKAEADAMKQDMKTWQKDYVTVLVDLEKKIDNSQVETKNLEGNLAALNIPALRESIQSLNDQIEKWNHSSAAGTSATSPAPDDKTTTQS